MLTREAQDLAREAALQLPDLSACFALADRLAEEGDSASAVRVRRAARSVERLWNELREIDPDSAHALWPAFGIADTFTDI